MSGDETPPNQKIPTKKSPPPAPRKEDSNVGIRTRSRAREQQKKNPDPSDSDSDDDPIVKLFQTPKGQTGNSSIRFIMFPGGLFGGGRKKDEEDSFDHDDEPTPPSKRPRLSCPHPLLQELSSEETKVWRNLQQEKQDAIVDACKTIERKMHGTTEEAALPTRFRVLLSKMPSSAKRLAIQRSTAIAKLPPFSTDGPKQQAWLDKLLHVPFGRYIDPPRVQDAPNAARELLMNLQTQMDKAVYGMPSVKKSIMQAMAQWIASPQSKGLVLGIQGPPGVGKTSLVRGIAATLGRPFISLNMGGFRDSAGLLGHEMTYVGSTNGALSDALIQSGCMNPVILMDEIDKISRNGVHGDEITGVLVHLTDETQNHEFQDRYFGPSVPLDFSRATMVFTFNDESAIDPILHNRMTVVRVPSLTRKEKIHIAIEYLWPSLQKELGLEGAQLSEDAVDHLLEDASVQEPGVRMLKTRLRQLLQAHQMATLLEEKVAWAAVPWTCEVDHVRVILEAVRGEAAASSAPPFGMYM